MDYVSIHKRRQIETFSFFHRLTSGADKPPKQTLEDRHVCHECAGEGYITNTRSVRHQHPADEWTIPSLLPISLNGSFT